MDISKILCWVDGGRGVTLLNSNKELLHQENAENYIFATCLVESHEDLSFNKTICMNSYFFPFFIKLPLKTVMKLFSLLYFIILVIVEVYWPAKVLDSAAFFKTFLQQLAVFIDKTIMFFFWWSLVYGMSCWQSFCCNCLSVFSTFPLFDKLFQPLSPPLFDNLNMFL